jgi:hypothetical protein
MLIEYRKIHIEKWSFILQMCLEENGLRGWVDGCVYWDKGKKNEMK